MQQKLLRYLFLFFVPSLFLWGYVKTLYSLYPSSTEIHDLQISISERIENKRENYTTQIPRFMKDALIATDDPQFYSHSGLQAKTIPLAFYGFYDEKYAFLPHSISIQLARNTTNSIGKTRNKGYIWRQFVYAFAIEKYFTKEEMLTAYFNSCNFYGAQYGVDAAACELFGKYAEDLNLQEQATLIAILKGQGVYNPVKYSERVWERRNFVLNKMAQAGYLTQHEADSVKKLKIVILGN